MEYKTQKEVSDLEKEHQQLKASLYEKFARLILIIFLLSSSIEVIRAIYYGKPGMMLIPLFGVSFVIFLLKVVSQFKHNQEAIVTCFNVLSYGLGLYSHHAETGYFDNVYDTFHFAYGFALMERLVFDRIPKASYKTVAYVAATLMRLAIIPSNDKSTIFIQMVIIIATIYFEFDQEKHYKTLFRTYFYSKEQLGKFKDLVENSIPEGIIVVTRSSMQSLFVNNAFKDLFEENKFSDTRSQLDSFYLRESLTGSDNTQIMSKRSLNLDKTLLGILEHRVSDNQDGLSLTKINGHYLSFSRVTGGIQNKRETRIFEYKILDIIWDEVPAFAVVLHDITEQHTILQLKISADLNKDRVLATVSHELRTPLNGILGVIQIMFKKIQDQELLHYLKICKNNANLLIGLVNSILDLNQIRFNKFRLSHDKVNIHDLLRDIESLFEYQCSQKGISLKLQISSLQKTIITDKNRLSQIFINLVGNALKFTVRGSITITARESQHLEMIEFSVEDTGMGIRREDRDKLFMMYGRLDHDDKKVNQQGVGLGLTISNSLAQILCGDDGLGGIKVESEYGKGSVFTFLVRKVLFTGSLVDTRLEVQDTYPSVTESFFVEEANGIDLKVKAYQMPPLKQNPGNSGRIFSAPHSPRSAVTTKRKEPINMLGIAKFNTEVAVCSKKAEPTILIVDDNPFNITVASYLVSNQGFRVKSALYGQTAIELLLKNDHKTEPIQLILMDCQMPLMDGYETTRNIIKLMGEVKIPKIPIVALTANNSAADREECKKAGMCDHLHKPLTEVNLVRVLKKYSC